MAEFRATWLLHLLELQLIDQEYLRIWEQFITSRAMHEWVMLMIARRPDRHQIMSQVTLPGVNLDECRLPVPSFWRLRRLVPCDELQEGINVYNAMIFSQQIAIDGDGTRAMALRVIDSLVRQGDEHAFLREASLCFMLIYRPTQRLSVKWSHARNCHRCKLDIQQQISIELALRLVCKPVGHFLVRLICDMLDCSEPSRW